MFELIIANRRKFINFLWTDLFQSGWKYLYISRIRIKAVLFGWNASDKWEFVAVSDAQATIKIPKQTTDLMCDCK